MAEILFSVLFFLVILVCFFQVIDLNIILSNGMFGSGLFPLAFTVVLMLLLLLHILNTIRARRKTPITDQPPVDLRILLKQLFLVGSLILLIWLVNFLGMLITLGIFLLFSLRIIENVSWKRSAIFGLGGVICIYFVFVFCLGIDLPKGVLRYV